MFLWRFPNLLLGFSLFGLLSQLRKEDPVKTVTIEINKWLQKVIHVPNVASKK